MSAPIVSNGLAPGVNAAIPTDFVYRLSVDQFHQMARYQEVRATYDSGEGRVARVAIDWLPRLPHVRKRETQVVFDRQRRDKPAVSDPVSQRVVEDYKRRRGGKIQTLVCIHPDKNPNRVREQVKRLADNGATMLYTHGEVTDHFTMNGQTDVLGKAVELMKEQGVPAGIGSHSLETPIASEKHGLGPDFYVKTFHMDRYWSASPKEHREEWCWYKPQASDMPGYHDNIWCLDAEKTAATMATIAKPWIAFKVMAAGAIQPRPAFGYAFRNGADFVVAGMFDFQIEEDVKIALDVLRKVDNRARPWRA